MDLPKTLFYISILAYLIAIGASQVFGIIMFRPDFLGEIISNVLIVATVFIFSAFFFGKIAPLAGVFAGIIQGAQFFQHPLNGLAMIPIIIALKGGIFLGQGLEEDIKEKEQEKLGKKLKNAAITFFLAIALMAAISFVLPELTKISPEALTIEKILGSAIKATTRI